MDQLLRRRAKLVSLKTALQLSCAQVPSLKADAAKLLTGFNTLLSKIDREIAMLTQAIPQRAQPAKRLESIIGVGPLTSAWLANLLDRVNSRTATPWSLLPGWIRAPAIQDRSAANADCPNVARQKAAG